MNKGSNIRACVEKYVANRSNPDELKDAIELFRDPYNHLELHPILYAIWREEKWDKKSEGVDDPSGMLNQIHHRINLAKTEKGGRLQRLSVNFMKMAAVLVVGLIAGFFITHFQKDPITWYTSIAPKGSISQVILPDSTMVYLNSGSEIKYTQNKGTRQREVYLSGEAWFDVAPNRQKPFFVRTPIYNVHVTGTRFNVKAYPEDNQVVTTIESGKVRVAFSENSRASTGQFLEPGQQLIYHKKNGKSTLHRVRPQMFTAWRNNQLIFINMNLKELFVLLERKYGVNIQVDDDIVLDYHYDGTIRNETILEVLDLLRETIPITYRISGQKVIINQK